MLRGYWSLQLAYAHLVSGLGRLALSILAITLGVALVVAVQLMNGAVLQSFLDSADAMAGRAALTVTAGDGVSFPESVVERVAAVPGLRLAVPLVTGAAFPDDASGEMLTVFGVDLTNDAHVRVYQASAEPGAVVDDLLVFVSQPDSIILGREFAVRRGLAVNDPIVLVTPQGRRRFVIRGLLEPEGTAKTLGGRLVVMDLYAAQRAFAEDGRIHQVDVMLADGANVDEMKTAVARVLPGGLRVHEPALRKSVIRRTVASFQGMLTAFALMAVLAGYVICFSRLRTLFSARTWEIGLARAMGLSRTAVFVELAKESLLLGVLGVMVGVPVGLLIGRYAVPFVATATALNFRWPVSTAGVTLGPGPLLVGLMVGLGAALAAAVFPALELARTQPVAALRMRGRARPLQRSWPSRLVAPVMLSLLGALLVVQRWTDLPAIGHATTAVVAVATWALGLPVVNVGGRLLAPLWEWVFGSSGEFAASHIREQARRAALTVTTLGLGLGSVLMFGLLGWSFERTLVGKLSAGIRADLVVTSAFLAGGYVPARLHEEAVDEIRRLPEVAHAAGEVEREIPFEGGVAILDAFDPVCFRQETVCGWPLEPGALPDALEATARGEAVFISDSFARLFRKHPGDHVTVESPQGPQTWRIMGVTTGDPETTILLSRERYRYLWSDHGVSWIHVAVASATDVNTAMAAITREMGQRYSLKVQTGAQMVAFFADQVRQAFSSLYVMQAVIFLLVAVAMGDMLASGVFEHTRLFAMLRAMGMTRTGVFAIVALEGLALSVLGLALALAVGFGLGRLWVDVEFPALLGWQLELHVPVGFVASAGFLTILLCLGAAILPSLRAAFISVPAGLRNE